MEMLYYYWSMWFLWIIATFIWKKDNFRFVVSIFLLINIILSQITLQIHFLFNAAYLLFYATAFFIAGRYRFYKNVRSVILHLSIVFSYCFFMLFALYDPIWFILKPEWLVTGVTLIIAVSFEKNLLVRLGTFLAGMCQGELLYWLIIHRIYDEAIIGSYIWLSCSSVGIVALYGVSQFESLKKQISQRMKNMGKGVSKMS